MPLTAPHTEVQNISTLNFAFKLMPPHKYISMFKEKKNLHSQLDSRKPTDFKSLLLSITTTALNPAAKTHVL